MYASKHRGRRDGVGSSWSRSSGSFGGSEPASLDGPPWQRVHPEPMEPSRRDKESAMTMPFGKYPDPKGIAGTATRTREAKTATLREKKLPSKEPPRPRLLQGREISTRREELRRTRRVAMVLVLCIGDFHVPYRSSGMPKKFLDMLVPGKIQTVLCTGNLCTRSMLHYLKSIAPDVHVVQGDFDLEEEYPAEKVVEIEGYRIGLLHGHQVLPWDDERALGVEIRKRKLDILVTGHTHVPATKKCFDCFVVNPGSATGAYATTGDPTATPNFVLLDLNEGRVMAYIYSLKDGELKVDKFEYTKAPETVSS